jgi:two-component system response regulator (stage 0 sporulation protein A)
MLLQTKPDVLLLDIVMPEMDGLEVLRKIMKENAPVVFIISAIGNEKIAKQALTLGARYFLVKPLNTQVLVSIIR